MFRSHPEAGFVCGDYRWCGDDRARHLHDCRPRPDYYGPLLRTNFIGAPHVVMFGRDIVEALGGFEHHLISCEDQDLYLRVARDYPVFCHHEVIAEYRRHPQQSSPRWDVMLRYAMQMLRAHAAAVAGHPEYEEAWRAGVEHRRRMYGEPLMWTMISSLRVSDWKGSIQYLGVLLRWYPRVLRRCSGINLVVCMNLLPERALSPGSM